ncbi:RluA family pseudouridine synthase [Stieleria sp. TO1_6]|uniref:RluA family pseudouridine synthase n=1 Tax=Stieleria tagensis TaxID=2956795 RepID=UPI00209AC0CB|nr:RluA family pseudouridine synthase [Stieleria tagensis]MCO8121222.1 RluA family pseudouridine synthase [Stieleria tagensis]
MYGEIDQVRLLGFFVVAGISRFFMRTTVVATVTVAGLSLPLVLYTLVTIKVPMPDSEIELIWESDLAIAINKPAGLPTQAAVGIESVETRLTLQLDRGDGYLAFPHRLDRAVSGVLLVALTKRAARLLSAQFASRKTAKSYLAIVEGQCDVQQRWDDDLRKIDGKPQAEICDADDAGARHASTDVTTLRVDHSNNRTLLRLDPITGRMHQLRLQTAHRGHPIIGDVLYGAHDIAGSDIAGSGIATDRILLHAQRLGFHDPASGKRLLVEANCAFADFLAECDDDARPPGTGASI